MQIAPLDSLGARRIGWIALLTVATIAASLMFACATPFPALAVLAALHMNRRDAFALTAVIWGTNQIIGYGLLHYPQTWDSFAWGIAIGAGAMSGHGACFRRRKGHASLRLDCGDARIFCVGVRGV